MSSGELVRDAVLEVHQPVEAVHIEGNRQELRNVCSGCGTDDGNWQAWPCPTVRVMERALSAAREAEWTEWQTFASTEVETAP